jgi:hypothetical protein
MTQEPWKAVADELARRAANRAARPRPRHGPQPKLLKEPDLASIRVLSEREAGDRCGVALTVNDATGERYLIIRQLKRDISLTGGWLVGGGSEGPDRILPDKPDPYLSMSAFATGGSFFAGGRVQSTSADVARVRLGWDDGYALEDELENGAVLFFGARDSVDYATVEFLDSAGRRIGAHAGPVDEPPRASRSRSPGEEAEFVWRRLNEETEVVSVRGAIVAVLYTVAASSPLVDRLEFCWLPIHRPDHVELLFGVPEETGQAWSTRWERARAAVESLL